jgi:hypothetical protein
MEDRGRDRPGSSPALGDREATRTDGEGSQGLLGLAAAACRGVLGSPAITRATQIAMMILHLKWATGATASKLLSDESGLRTTILLFPFLENKPELMPMLLRPRIIGVSRRWVAKIFGEAVQTW